MLTNRFPLFVALIAIAALALFTISMVTLAHPAAGASLGDQAELERAQNYIANAERSYDQIELQRAQNYASQAARQAYLDQRHGEQTIGAAADFGASSQAFRQAEQAAALADAERAYQEWRHGEWTAGEASFVTHPQNRPVNGP